MFVGKEKKARIETVVSKFELTDFKWIDPKDIIVAHWVRMKCLYGCGDYGRACCPPNVPTVNECREFFNEYTAAIVFRFHFDAEKGNYPKAYSQELYKDLLDLEREIFLSGYHKAFIFGQSNCSLCKECVHKKEDCKHPEKHRPSPEAFAIDVYGTVRNLGYEINVVSQPHQEIDRFAILMIE
jgi:predicted metal-binding protein